MEGALLLPANQFRHRARGAAFGSALAPDMQEGRVQARASGNDNDNVFRFVNDVKNRVARDAQIRPALDSEREKIFGNCLPIKRSALPQDIS